MNFLAPAAFAFAATIPVVVIFYLLKRRRVVRLVPSTLLWQKFLAETQASAPFQRLRKNWLMLLQILLMLLAVLALARPYYAAQTQSAQLRVIILDGSASMRATDEAPSRFDKARAEALSWVEGLKGAEQMVVVLAGGNTEVKQSATSDKAALRRALQNSSCFDSPTRLVPALRMAESLVREHPSAQIHLFSDGAIPELKEFESKGLPLTYHRMGSSGDNMGLTAVDVRANPENPRQRAIYANIVNFSSNSMRSDLDLWLEDRHLETRSLTIPPGESSPQVLIADQDHDGVFRLQLDVKDALTSDNQARIVSLLPKPIRALLLSRGNSVLEKALRSAGNVQLSAGSDLPQPEVGFDLVAIDGLVPSSWPKANALVFNAVNTNWLEGAVRIDTPPIVDWKASHPLLRYAPLDNVQILQSFAAPPPSWAVSLADAPQASLMLAGELGRQRLVWVGFDPLESTWPLRVSFPIFMANAVEWLGAASSSGSHLMVRSGDAFRIPLQEPVTKAELTLPNGESRTIPVDSGASEFVLADTSVQGAYKLVLGTNVTVFCVNLLDAAESNIRPKDELQLGAHTRVSATAPQRANLELWRGLAGLGLALLLFEWWYYHRRTV